MQKIKPRICAICGHHWIGRDADHRCEATAQKPSATANPDAELAAILGVKSLTPKPGTRPEDNRR